MNNNKLTNKPGYKTTEFWLTVLTVIATVAGSLVGILPGTYATIATAIASAAYAISRAITKQGETDINKFIDRD